MRHLSRFSAPPRVANSAFSAESRPPPHQMRVRQAFLWYSASSSHAVPDVFSWCRRFERSIASPPKPHHRITPPLPSTSCICALGISQQQRQQYLNYMKHTQCLHSYSLSITLGPPLSPLSPSFSSPSPVSLSASNPAAPQSPASSL